MNIVQQQQELESFSDDMLANEVRQGTGRYPGFLIMTEMQRRKELRERAKNQQFQPQPTVTQKLASETMQQGIGSIPGAQVQGFAEGGLVQGYANGGGPDPKTPWQLAMEARAARAQTPRRFWEWSREQSALREAERAEEVARAQQNLGIAGPAPAAQPQGPQGIAAIEPRTNIPTETSMAGQQSGPLGPYQSGLGVRDPRFEAEQSARRDRDPLGVSMMRNLAERQAGIEAMRASMQGNVDEYAAGHGARVQELREMADGSRESYESVIEALKSGIQEGPSNLESELEGLRKTPEQGKKEKLAIALSGIGSLISSGSNIGAGMASVTADVIARSDMNREEEIELVSRIGQLEEARKNRNVELKTAAARAEVGSEEAARAIALQAFDEEENMQQFRFNMDQVNLSTAQGFAQAESEIERMLISVEEAARSEQVARQINPDRLATFFESYRRSVKDMMDSGFADGDEMQNALDSMQRMSDAYMQILNAQSRPLQSGAAQGTSTNPRASLPEMIAEAGGR